MGRSARLAIGVVVAAIAVEPVGANVVGAIIALAMAGLLVIGEIGSREGARKVWPVVIGAGLIAARLAVLPGGPTALQAPPDGDGPWNLTVLTTGAPRDGHQTSTLGTPPETVPGFTVAATLPRYPVVIPGDRIRVDGQMRPRPDSPYGEYLARIGAAGTLTVRSLEVVPAADDPWRRLETLRRGAADALAGVLPEPEAGLAAGILIGLRDRVDRDLAAAFTTAGVSHIVAISGWNIAIVAAAIATLAGGLGRRRRSVVTVVAIVAYVCFAGASASVVRAAMMAGVVLLARESGRAGRAAGALGWAATLLLVADPGLIRDAGFQLSSLATAGLIAWATPMTDWIDRVGRGRVPRWLAESLGVSLAAQAATLPIVLVSFGRLAILSPLVNLAVVPLVAPAMGVGLVALAAGIAVQLGMPAAVGAILAAPGWVILRILVAIVQVAASLPFASLTLEPPFDLAVAGLAVAGLAGVTVWRRRRRSSYRAAAPPVATNGVSGAGDARGRRDERGRHEDRRARRAATVALVVAVTVAGGVVVSRPTGVASVTILDVGQGDAVLIEGSRGGRLLVDGGPDPDRLLVALDRRIPPWDRRIDSVILSHPHEDHVAGLGLLLERYDVERVMEPGMRGPGPGYAAWLNHLSDVEGPMRTSIAAGDRLAVDDIDLRVLWPVRDRVPLDPPDGGTGINNVSVVLAGQIGNHRFLLMGDVEEEIDPELLARGLRQVDLLKVAHHGSRTATTQAFVDAVRPRVAVASAGAGNPYGHPTRLTMERLANAGARVLRTDRDGTVVATFEGSGIKIRSEGARNGPPTPNPSRAASAAFRCAIPVTAIVPEREPPSDRRVASGWRPEATSNERPSWAATVGYHRIDDRSRAGGGRRPPALPVSGSLVRAARARGRRSGGLAGGPDRRARVGRGPAARRGRSPAPRCRQGAAGRRSLARAPPRRRLRSLVDSGGPPGAWTGGGEPPRDPAARWRTLPALGRLCVARGADRGIRRQAGRSTARIDGCSLRVVAASLPARRRGTCGRLGCDDVRGGQEASSTTRNRRLSSSWRSARRGPPAPLDRSGDSSGAGGGGSP
jgi:competence protein ComEC